MPSSVIAAMNYNDASCALTIVFVSGLVYQYLHVPAEVFAKMKTARSKGIFLNKEIKGRYTYVKKG